MNEQVWWHLARASGIVAWALATAAVLWGLALSSRALGKRPPAPWLLDLHRHLGGLTVLMVAVHLWALVADSFVHFDAVALFVPFASEWKAAPVAWGVLALYGLVAVEASSLLTKRLPKKTWRRIHMTSYAVYVLSTLHFVTAGTDATHPVLALAVVLAAAAVLGLTAYRALVPRSAALRPMTHAPARIPDAATPSSAGADVEAGGVDRRSAPARVRGAAGSATAATADERRARLAAARASLANGSGRAGPSDEGPEAAGEAEPVGAGPAPPAVRVSGEERRARLAAARASLANGRGPAGPVEEGPEVAGGAERVGAGPAGPAVAMSGEPAV